MSVRRLTVALALTTLGLIGALVLSGCMPAIEAAAISANEAAAPRTITVVGRGQVKAKPDIATTTIGVEETAATVEVAMSRAGEKMSAILGALEQLGIADKDIQTSNFSINFERQPLDTPASPTKTAPANPEQPAGFYRVSNLVQVTIRDLDQVGTVLDEAVKAGANNVWGVTFGLSETQTLEADARAAAVNDARARAESLAELNGLSLGDVMAVSETISGGPIPVFAEAAARGLGGGGGTPVEPGELTFSTQIQVIYAVR